MLQPGLVSVTFRGLPLREIVDLAAQTGLEGIEWGGDVHVPPGVVEKAREAAHLCREYGLAVASYGSYYRLGQADGDAFQAVLDTCLELGAPNLRVWAGSCASSEADPATRARVAADARRCAELAGKSRTQLSLEFHSGTLTDSVESAMGLLQAAGQTNLRCYWQPPLERPAADNLADLALINGQLSNIHCFHLKAGERRPLAEGWVDWREYLRAVRRDGAMRWILLEFVRGDEPSALLEDARALKIWLADRD